MADMYTHVDGCSSDKMGRLNTCSGAVHTIGRTHVQHMVDGTTHVCNHSGVREYALHLGIWDGEWAFNMVGEPTRHRVWAYEYAGGVYKQKRAYNMHGDLHK